MKKSFVVCVNCGVKTRIYLLSPLVSEITKKKYAKTSRLAKNKKDKKNSFIFPTKILSLTCGDDHRLRLPLLLLPLLRPTRTREKNEEEEKEENIEYHHHRIIGVRHRARRR